MRYRRRLAATTVQPAIAPAPAQPAPASPISTDPGELRLLACVRAGDEAAFAELVRQYSPTMVRLARLTVGTRAVAEEVVQEAWIGVLNGIGRFEGRSTLKTWIFRILLNKANTHAAREARGIPFSAMDGGDPDPGEPSVDPIASLDRKASGRGTGLRLRFASTTSPKSACSQARPLVASPPRSQRCRPLSAPWSRCATSRAGARRTSVACSV